jgi:hypothetical protein
MARRQTAWSMRPAGINCYEVDVPYPHSPCNDIFILWKTVGESQSNGGYPREELYIRQEM